MNGGPNRGNKAALSNIFSGVVRKGPEQKFRLLMYLFFALWIHHCEFTLIIIVSFE